MLLDRERSLPRAPQPWFTAASGRGRDSLFQNSVKPGKEHAMKIIQAEK